MSTVCVAAELCLTEGKVGTNEERVIDRMMQVFVAEVKIKRHFTGRANHINTDVNLSLFSFA